MIALATASSRRLRLMTEAGVSYKAVPTRIDESFDGIYLPIVPLALARRKAEVVSKDCPDCLVIGADTVIFFEGKILGKPASRAEAADYLKTLSGKTHEVVTGVYIIRESDRARVAFTDTTQVTFRVLDDKIIRRYHDLVNPLDKAGGYAIQENGDTIIRSIQGSRYNVIGLPMEKLLETLRHLNAIPR